MKSVIDNLSYADALRWFNDLPDDARLFEREVAKITRKSTRTIRRWREHGVLPAVRPPGQREYEYIARDVRARFASAEEA